MKPDEVLPVEGEHRSLLRDGEGEDLRIRDALVGAPCLTRGQDVVPMAAQHIDRLPREVLVRVEARHLALVLVVLLSMDVGLDLLRMLLVVAPGCPQV